MKYSTVLSLTAIFTGYVLADTSPTCSTTGDNKPITSTCCPRTPSKRLRRSAREIFARADSPPTCPTPDFYPDSCCTHEFAKPTLDQGKFNLQCGANDEADIVQDAVKVEIVGCDTADDLTKDSCYLMISSTPAGTIKDTHLEISTDAWATKVPAKDPASWSYNSYCVKTTGVCQVPLNKIPGGATALCDKSLYVAYHTSTLDGTTSRTCTGEGTPIPGQPGGRWWEYLTLTFTCPKTCDGWCCCPSSQPPSTKVCDLGTAFGYAEGAKTLNPDVCDNAKRWGWYFATSQTTLGGKLYVGAGNNDLSKATIVGTWSATLTGSDITFHYNLYNDDTQGHYDLSSVHVYASCTAPTTCAPGQFTFKDDTLTGNSDTSYSKTFAVADTVSGTCSTYYLIFHATVNEQIPSTETCPQKED